MGFEVGKRAWQRPTEQVHARFAEQKTGFDGFVEGAMLQVQTYVAEKPAQASVFKNAGHAERILNAKNPRSAAAHILHENAHFIPDHIVDDERHQIAFLVALAYELDKPQYDQ